MRKKILMVLLASCLVVNLLPVSVFAAGTGMVDALQVEDETDAQTEDEEVLLEDGTLSEGDGGLEGMENEPMAYADTTASGTCGENLTWTLDDKGILTISGTGSMYNYSVWRDNKAVREVVIQPGVTIIGEHAFADCNDMTSIIIPDSVTSIGSHAFYSCNSLTSIVIPNSVTSIGDAAFVESLSSIHVDINNANYCSDNGVLFNKDKTLLIQYPHEHPDRMYRIPDSVTSIGSSAFEGCRSLTNVTIPNSVTSIGDRSFFGCISLTDITIPDSVASIGNAAFYVCGNLTRITIPDSVTSIGSGAFYGCCKLTSIALPDSVTSIGSGVFAECGSLTNITLPDSMTSIGNETFLRCGSLINITIPDSVTSIGDKAFWACGSLTNITIPDSVTSIGNSAFAGCVNLTSITIPNSVTSIGDSETFKYCSSLTNITLPDGVVAIGYEMFKGCSNLTSITLPDGVILIGSHAFENCSRLTNITLPDSVTSIWSGAFYKCSSLTSVTIPDSVTSIEDAVFYGCDRLIDIYYSGGESDWKAIKVGGYGNEPLSNATIHYNSTGPDDLGAEPINGILRSGDGWAIRWECNYKLDRNGNPRNGRIEISVNDTNTTEELYLYNEASELGFPWELEPYNIPKSAITTLVIRGKPTKKLRITADSFKGYSNLKNVVLEYVSGMDSNSFEGCSSLQYFGFLSDGTPLSVIDNGSFRNCTGLKEIDFPASLKRIGAEAFQNTALGTVTLGKNITEIGDNAFSGCQDLLIRCYSGSVAHLYAQANNIPFQLITGNENLKYVVHYGGGKTEPFEHNLDYYVSNTASTTYSPQLSHMLIAMSCAAYSESDIKKSMKEMGFSNDNIDSHYNDDLIAYAFGKKTMTNGKTLVLVTIRGSETDREWKSNIDLGLGNLILGCFWHEGFESAVNTVYNDLDKFVGGNLKDTVFVVTGHSRGAAVANLLEVKLFDAKVASANVYGYNFACPDVAVGLPTGWNWFGEHNNIFNIGNSADIVSIIPGVLGTRFLSGVNPLTSWGKFGQSRWFSKDWTSLTESQLNLPQYAHGQEVYLEYLKQEPSFSSFKTWEERRALLTTAQMQGIGKLFSVCCPVDVRITDSSGNTVASVIDGVVNYYDSDFGEVIIFTDGDKKSIFVQQDAELTIHLEATDDGTMDYIVQTVDFELGEVLSEKTFSNVTLTDGKQMMSVVNNGEADGTDVSQVLLYVLGEDGEPEKEVLPDGNGTEVPWEDTSNKGKEKFASYEGFDFYRDTAGNITCLDSTGAPVINEFKCDGIYTYYFQADGTAMKDRLTYHPDGVHVIYFDGEGHETFDSFALVGHNIPSMETGIATELNEYCYFNTFGYQYTDVVTYDVKGEKLYYANTGGVLERSGWFSFSGTVTYAGDGKPWSAAGQRGYANGDCTLMKDTFSYDENGNLCYMQGNGAVTYDF